MSHLLWTRRWWALVLNPLRLPQPFCHFGGHSLSKLGALRNRLRRWMFGACLGRIQQQEVVARWWRPPFHFCVQGETGFLPRGKNSSSSVSPWDIQKSLGFLPLLSSHEPRRVKLHLLLSGFSVFKIWSLLVIHVARAPDVCLQCANRWVVFAVSFIGTPKALRLTGADSPCQRPLVDQTSRLHLMFHWQC